MPVLGLSRLSILRVDHRTLGRGVREWAPVLPAWRLRSSSGMCGDGRLASPANVRR